jgi:branched-chain amino acid transport system permease protein
MMGDNPLAYSLANQVLIAVTATFSVYIMLRMNLLTFAVPTFMAVGGYTAAICGLRYGITDTIVLAALSFAVPALLALPLGALVLRLRGVYFVLVTFVLTEITELVLFETPGLTGGSNGLVGMPVVTLFGFALADNRGVLLVSIGVALLGAIITAVVTGVFRQHFAAIEENELLAQSLGLVVWHYKAFGFLIAAGVSGLAGFALVNMLLTAHPSSFSPLSSVNYIAYAIIGGKSSMLGPVIGGTLLVVAADMFSARGEYSQFLFGLLIVIIVLVAKEGIFGGLAQAFRRLRPASRPKVAPSLSASMVTEGQR